jgi:hypothetical protein
MITNPNLSAYVVATFTNGKLDGTTDVIYFNPANAQRSMRALRARAKKLGIKHWTYELMKLVPAGRVKKSA